MTDMVEQVARAMCERQSPHSQTWPGHLANWHELAKVAIAAMQRRGPINPEGDTE